MRGLVCFLSGLVWFFIVWSLSRFGYALTASIPLLQFISQPAFIIIGVGVGAQFYSYVPRFVNHHYSLQHVIALTALHIGLEVNGSIYKFAKTSLHKNLFQVYATSLATLGSIAVLKGVKDGIMKNDIMPRISLVDKPGLKFVKKTLVHSISELVSYVDELTVSYSWFMTYAYANSGEKDALKLSKQIKTQAGFMLEGVVYVIRTMPKLLLKDVLTLPLYAVIRYGLYIMLVLLMYLIYGIDFLFLAFIFIFSNTVLDIITHVVIYPLRLARVMEVFWKEVDKLESPATEAVKELVGKVPSLGTLAMKTKREEYAGIKKSDTLRECSSALLDLSSVDEIFKKATEGLIATFKVQPEDLVEPSPELEEAPEGDAESISPKESPASETSEPPISESSPPPESSPTIKPVSFGSGSIPEPFDDEDEFDSDFEI